MGELASLFETNRFILYSVYGQVFFVMGLAVALQSRRYSQFAHARSLWLLGAFGILHGMSEWAFVFIPVQRQYMATNLIELLWLGHAIVVAASFAVLFQFGVELVVPKLASRRLRLLPSTVFAVWVLLSFAVESSIAAGGAGQADGPLFMASVVLARYLMGLPGAVLVALGLFQTVKIVELMDLPGIVRYFRGAAVAFLAYAVLAGLLVEPAGFFPANALNYDLTLKTFGIPVIVFRSFCGLAIAYCVVRALKVFDVEMDRMIERMERAQMLAVERERIGRELHDGTIQSIYAAGLELEELGYLVEENPALARDKVRRVMDSLDRTIADIRGYIHGLNSGMENREFEDQLCALAAEFAGRAGITPHVRIKSLWRRPFTSEQAAHLLQVARESFANVSRHARASRVEVLLTYGKDAATLEIRDDGCGFNPRGVSARAGGKQGLGLRNLYRRIEMIGGRLRIQTAPGHGTKVIAQVPLELETQ